MVKFSKELEAQLIPEWKDAFVNYWLLKKQIKKIKLARQPKHQHPYHNNYCSYYFSSFINIFNLPLRSLSHQLIHTSTPSACATTSSPAPHHELQAMKRGAMEENEDHEELDGVHDTVLSQLFSEEDEVKVFFEMLDEELEKVNQFYNARETELMEKGEALNKQLDILLNLKQILHARQYKSFLSPTESFHGGVYLSRSNSSSLTIFDYSENTPDMNEDIDALSQTDEMIAALERNELSLIGPGTRPKTQKGKPNPKTSLRIDIPGTNMTRSISAISSALVDDPLNKDSSRDVINRKKIQCAEKRIRGAFVELYKGLGLLKTYSSLNMLAFKKILKKFDKVANRQSSSCYLNMVKRSHFISSDKVVRQMDEVETIFIKHFADNDRKKAMKFLRPQQHKDSHLVTFFVGLFTGCFVTLFTVYVVLAHFYDMFSSRSDDEFGYMETIYPILSIFALLSLHLFIYGCNLLMWKATRINYTFIFEFSPKTSLKYRDAFLICTTLMTAVVGALIIHLIFLRSNVLPPQQTDAIPGILFLILFALLICPFNIFYRPTRYSFLKVMRNIVCSPFYKVLMVDFFMADQLTSQIPLLRHMETTTCYFLTRSFKTHHYDICKKGKLYKEFAYVISFAPYYWRAMQCAKRWFDEDDPKHLANLGKYVSAMVAAGARLAYGQAVQQGPSLLCTILAIVTSVVATIYQLYWDFVQDWGFFNPHSRNPWLRDDLILKNKCVYYISIVINLVLRVTWVASLRKIKVAQVEENLLDFILASLEVIRRGHWNFYRLENEHLNNVGHFRAVKTVPLPFTETYLED